METNQEEVMKEEEVTPDAPEADNTPAADDSDSATETEKTSTEEDNSGEPKKEKKEKKDVPLNVQRRIDKLTKEKYEAAREAAYYKGLAQASGRTPSDMSAAKPVDVPPKSEDFANYDDYIKASIKWDLKQEEIKRTEQARTEVETKTITEKNQALFAKIEAKKNLDDDFSDKIDTLPLSHELFRELSLSDYGIEILSELADNPSEAERITKLSVYEMVKEVGRLEARHIGAKKTPAAKVSKAPAPIKPIAGSGGGMADIESMSMAEYAAYEKARVLEKRKR